MTAESCSGDRRVASRARKNLCKAFLDFVDNKLVYSLEPNNSPGSSVERRVTRSAVKQCRSMFGCRGKPAGGSMKPPANPSFRLKRKSYPGVVTRTRHAELCKSFTVKNNRTLDCASNTSDYGTMSEDSRYCSREGISFNSHDNGSLSGIESLKIQSDDNSEDGFVMNDKHLDLSNISWNSDDGGNECDVDEWDSKAELDYFKHLRESTKVSLLRLGPVAALIPLTNETAYNGKFEVHLIENEDNNFYRNGLCCSMRIHHVSPVVSLEPHGTAFYESFPAIVIISLNLEPQDETLLSCLYSNTRKGEVPVWERLPKTAYAYRNGSLVITAHHFSLFTVILEEPYPEKMKRIRCRVGGRLRLADVPGLQVEFPRGCLEEDVHAYVRVLFDSEPWFRGEGCWRVDREALASPIIMLGPHGYEFSAARPPVLITLPVPDYEKIKVRFPNAQLTIWQSLTQEGEPMQWEPLNAPISTHTTSASSGHPPLATFPVHHFSFFRLVWDILASSLYEAKMGMSYFYPYISFSMMCQAFMEQSTGDNRFALEVICYRSDRRLPEATNYRHRVGASLKPKLVRPGRISVRLKSQMFEADVDAGEDEDMVKEEPDFRGRDFEKQYACRFKPSVNVDRGTFGKVIVERLISGAKDPLFEFNLHKSGLETDVSLPVGCERWTVFAMKELASSLQITEGNNWKKFAQYIGFTKNEIKSKLQYTADPFLAMMNLYNTRGGTPEEFTQALYAVSRDLHVGKRGTNSDRSRSSHSAGSGSDSKASSSQGSAGPSKGLLWSFWGRNNNETDSEGDSVRTEENKEKTKKRSWSGSRNQAAAGSSAKRRRYSDVSETVSSDSDDSDEKVKTVSTEKHKRDPRTLSDKDLWRISSKIVSKDWRNLGRTLGIEEQVLQNLNHSHQGVGLRECTYQMLLEWKSRKPRKCTFGELYSALHSEGMVAVAKHLVKYMRQYDVEDSP